MRSKAIVATIGVFDGVHRGHQALLRRTRSLAGRLKAEPWVLTFRDHPQHVLRGGPKVPFLLPREGTFRLLRAEGIRRVLLLPFTKRFSRKSPEEFVRWILAQGDLKGIVVGGNFRFGRDARGDVPMLKAMGRRMGFRVEALDPLRSEGEVVSSSLIRRLLMEGRLARANRLLGRSYSIRGKVVHGGHVGHRIGFPTANLGGIPEFLPRDGVYACAVPLGKKLYRAGMNLGKRPTFRRDRHERRAEVHLLRYYGGLYGRKMRVYLLDYLRPERKFASSKSLVRQIQRDLKRVQGTRLRGIAGGR